jgi:septal ring factor EnvC (AmiA/AmiB activator)
MDSETLKLLRQATTEGLYSASWLLIAISLVAGGIGAYFGAYLKTKAEHRATKEDFAELLKQVESQTRAVETIKGEITEQVTTSTDRFRAELAKDLARFQALLQIPSAEAAFIRELYADGLREYAIQQAQGLRQAYLILFEPESSTISVATKTFPERIEMAIEQVMKPLRDHLGILDEETIKQIYAVQNELLKSPLLVEDSKQDFLDATEQARQFVSLDKIAWRLGLITKPFERRTS